MPPVGRKARVQGCSRALARVLTLKSCCCERSICCARAPGATPKDSPSATPARAAVKEDFRRSGAIDASCSHEKSGKAYSMLHLTWGGLLCDPRQWPRSDARRVGKECVSKGSTGCAP